MTGNKLSVSIAKKGVGNVVNKIFEDDNFFEEYLNAFCGRFTNESLDLSFETPLPYTKHGIKFHNNYKALQQAMLFLNEERDIRINEMIEIADLVNGPDAFIRKGFRKTYVEVNGADWKPSEADQIYNHINNLFGNYF